MAGPVVVVALPKTACQTRPEDGETLMITFGAAMKVAANEDPGIPPDE